MLPRSWVRISLEAKYLQHLSAQLIHYIPLYISMLYIYTEGYSESTIEAKYLQHLSAQLIHYIPLYISMLYIYTEGYSESTEPIDAVNILPLARFEPTTSATPPSTTPDINATNWTTETSPKKDVQEALILMMTDAVHVVYWFFFNGWHLYRFASESLMDPRKQVKLDRYQKCGNIISQTSLLSSYTGSETDADSDSR